MIQTENDILQLVKEDKWMMDILRTAKTLQLPDWWVCAGFVRSKIWDSLHGFKERTPTSDIDVIYFDEESTDESVEKRLEERLKTIHPNVPWSVKNEARMHVRNNIPPYSSAVDAISKFPETATALGLKLDDEDNLVLAAPCGLEDVLHLQVKPTPFFMGTKELARIYEERIIKKNWKSIWHKINITHLS